MGLIFFSALLFLTRCTVAKMANSNKEGVVLITTTFYNTLREPFDSSSNSKLLLRKWFKDGFLIEEVRVWQINKDLQGHTTNQFALKGFVFKDIKRGRAYEFLHFSDSAKPVLSFDIKDSVKLVGGTIYRPASTQPFFSTKLPYSLPDTVINQIRFKRLGQTVLLDEMNTCTDVYYLRSDLGDFFLNLFNINNEINNASPWKAVKVIRKPSLESEKLVIAYEISEISSQLSSEENRVFEAWKKKVN